jgi:hypothetical protein
MSDICLCCGRIITPNQYGAESEGDFQSRLDRQLCRAKCKRTYGKPKVPRPTSTLGDYVPAIVGEGVAVEKDTTPRDAAYLDFVRTFDCCVCHWPAHLKKIEAHHIYTGGTSIKCSDYDTVPLCAHNARGCHYAADKSIESAEEFKPFALYLNTVWIQSGHKLKKSG